MTRFKNFLKAPQPKRARRARNVEFVGSDVLPGSEEFLELDGREESAQRLALTLPSAFGAMSNVAKMCAQHEPHVGRQAGPDDKPEPQKNHPFERVLWRPNEWMSNTFLFWFLYMALPLRGEAFLFVEDGGLPTGDVLELWPIPPWRVKPVPSKKTTTFISHYNYWPQSGAEPIRMPTSNICWIRQPNVLDLHVGMSTVSPGQMPVDLAHKQWQYMLEFYGPKRGRPEMAVGVKKDVTPTAFNKLKREWFEEMHVLNRGTLFHRSGDIVVQRLDSSADDMQLLQFQAHVAEVVQQLFGWNSSLGKATSYAHADVSWEIVAQIGAWPLMKLVSGALTTQVLQPRYGEDIVAHYDDIRPKRRDADRADYQVYGQDRTTNEQRILRGDKPITTGPLAEIYETVTIRTLQMAGAQAAPETATQEPARPVVSEDVKADLQKWERKALRTVRESASGAAAFESEFIPAHLHTDIAGVLIFSTTEAQVKEAFSCYLQHSIPS